MNPLTRVCALALSASSLLAGVGMAQPERAGQHGLAHTAAGDGLAPLVPLRGLGPGERPSGPQDASLPPGGSQFAPTGVPEEVTRLYVKVERENRLHFPVDGPFNWGQEGARFGAARGGRGHDGQDVFALAGTPLVAVRDGVVVEQGDGGGRGNYVAVYHPAVDRTYVYLHLNAPARVRAGQPVRGGQRVGEVGCSGSCFGDHLHFEVRRGRDLAGAPLDPLPELESWTRWRRAQATLPPGAS